MSNSFPSQVLFAASEVDGFGRQRVSQPETVFDADFLTSRGAMRWAELSTGTGAVTYTINTPHVQLAAGPGVGKAVRQSRAYIPYFPGKSFLAFITGILETSGGGVGATSRIGMFDDIADKTVNVIAGNGFFFQLVGTALSVVYRNGISGAQVDTVVAQADWNIDRFDGFGPSGVRINLANRQIFFIELEWLGAGSATLGFLSKRHMYPCHQFNFANQAGPSAFSNRGSLPIRHELSSAGGVGAVAAVARQICCSVASEGGVAFQSSRSRVFSHNNTNIVLVVSAAVERPVLSLRVQAARNRTFILPLVYGGMCTTNADLLFSVYRFIAPLTFNAAGPLTAAVWAAANPSTVVGFTDMSAAEVDVAATAVDLTNTVYPFVKIASFYVSDVSNAGTFGLTDALQAIVADIRGNGDWLVICARRVATAAGNESVVASIQWSETE